MNNTYEIKTTQNVALSLNLATLGDRIAAYIIDILIKYAYVLLILLIMAMILGGSKNETFIITIVIILLIPVVFYSLIFEIFYNGQTIGKKSMSIQVASLNGEEVSIRQYLLRWLFRLVDFSLLSVFVALITAASTTYRQRIGDLVAGTVVVSNKKRYNVRSTVFQEYKEDYEPIYLAAKNLQPQEVAIIKEVLDNKMLERNDRHIDELAERLSDHLGVQFEEHPRKFLRTLLRDYSFLRQS